MAQLRQKGNATAVVDANGNLVKGNGGAVQPAFTNEKAARDWATANNVAVDSGPKKAAAEADDPNAERVNEINAELGDLEGQRAEAAKNLDEARKHSVEYMQTEVDRLRARTDALVAERARLLPPAERDEKADAAAEASLLRNGWRQDGEMWVCTRPFTCRIGGHSTSVSAGVMRTLDEAAALDSHRSA